jgi:hypothetical protein
MTRFQKLLTSFFALMALAAFALRLMSMFAPPADRPADRPPIPRQSAICRIG